MLSSLFGHLVYLLFLLLNKLTKLLLLVLLTLLNKPIKFSLLIVTHFGKCTGKVSFKAL